MPAAFLNFWPDRILRRFGIEKRRRIDYNKNICSPTRRQLLLAGNSMPALLSASLWCGQSRSGDGKGSIDGLEGKTVDEFSSGRVG